MKNVVIFLCDRKEDVRERRGYTTAFRDAGYSIVFCSEAAFLKDILLQNKRAVFCVIHPEPYVGFHPVNLWDFKIPNIIIQWDTFTIPKKRVLAARPYDIQVICHPGYENYYKRHGCENVLLLPWCIDDLLLAEVVTNRSFEKTFDIGWVGRSDATFYSYRRAVLQMINENHYGTNDTNKYYSWHEMFCVFLQSKLVINVSRDDHLADANMRCFEAMGCGALLFTKKPTELDELGFKSGYHFIGYINTDDLKNKIEYYLKNEKERSVIADRGRELVLSSHTYRTRVASIISYVKKNGELAIDKSWFRKLSSNDRHYYLAFGHYKEGNARELYKAILKVNMTKKIKLLPMFLKLKLRSFRKKYLCF